MLLRIRKSVIFFGAQNGQMVKHKFNNERIGKNLEKRRPSRQVRVFNVCLNIYCYHIIYQYQ